MSANEHVLALLRSANKPFSVQSAVDNLQAQGIKKAMATRALEELVKDGHVQTKEFGARAFALYWLRQDDLETMDAEELRKTQAENESLRAELDDASAAARAAQARLGALKAARPLAELREQVKALKDENAKAEAKLKAMRGAAAAERVTAASRDKVVAKLAKGVAAWRKRKRMFRNIFDTVMEGLEGKKAKDVLEDVGVETDEAAKADLSKYEEVAQRHPPTEANGRAAAGAGGFKRRKLVVA
ncbi:unnamed protein product [Pedinophyceae sp. YPF-701]|nr:unnamed protein product [Pedinophyceae sp. YPF-701]